MYFLVRYHLIRIRKQLAILHKCMLKSLNEYIQLNFILYRMIDSVFSNVMLKKEILKNLI